MYFDEVGDTVYAFNNTIFDIKQSAASGGGQAYGLSVGNSTVHARNNYVGDVISAQNLEYAYDGTFSTTTNNVSSDATATGTNSQTGKSDYPAYFMNTTAGAEDLHLRNDSNALWGSYGADLDGDADLPVTTNVDGDARHASQPDIGADEFTGSPVTRAIYYSVGTSTADLKSGSPTLTISNGTATFSVAQPNSVGVGDEITYSGTLKAYISARTSSTVYSVTTAVGSLPANVTNATVNSIKRAFNLLSTAEANSGAASYLGATDLVASNYQLNWTTYNDGAMNDRATVSSWTTGANNYIRIYAPYASAEVGTSQRHTGVAGSGFRMAPVSASPAAGGVIWIEEEYVRVEGIEIDGNGLTNAPNLWGIYTGSALSTTSDGRFDGNIVHGLHDTASSGFTAGILINGGAGAGAKARISNNIIYDVSSNQYHVLGIMVSSATTSYAYNNTVYNIKQTKTGAANGAAWGISARGNSGTTEAKNNYVGDVIANVDSEWSYQGVSATLNQQANVSFDSFASGTGSQTGKHNYAAYFVNVTGGSENLHLLNNSNALWGSYGADLDQDANLPITIDIDRDARDATQPDIGADEYGVNQAPSAPQTPYAEGQTSPVSGVTALTPELSAIYDDPNTSDTAIYYEIEVNTASDFL